MYIDYLHNSASHEPVWIGAWPPLMAECQLPEDSEATPEPLTLPQPEVTNAQLRDRFTEFARVGREGAQPLRVVRPSLPVKGPEHTLPVVERWLTAFAAIDENAPDLRFQFLEPSLARMAEDMHRGTEDNQLQGALALALICTHGLHKRTRTRTPRQFIEAYLRRWNLGASAPRVSRLYRGARFWLELWSAQLPVPARISTLEELVPRKTRISLYRTLVTKNDGKAPTARMIFGHLVARGYLANKTPEQRTWKIVDQAEAVIAILNAEEQTAGVVDALAKLQALRDTIKPRRRVRRVRANREGCPPYGSALGCPVILRQLQASVEIRIRNEMPEPQWATTWQRSLEEGWRELPRVVGVERAAWEAPINAASPAEARSAASTFVDYFDKMCAHVGAPAPRLEVAA